MKFIKFTNCLALVLFLSACAGDGIVHATGENSAPTGDAIGGDGVTVSGM